ncbi:hypothetical protein CEP53_002101 [Fusarium sp. AF-6]|nr:hypothetical protein CEP53_002101 [Fusarium sp. AF-6]
MFLTSASPSQRTLLGEQKVGGRLELDAVVKVKALRSHTVQAEKLSAMEREIRELEDEKVRLTNAYPGASNTIGSVHQRRWYVSLDRPACGFVEKRTKGRSTWELDNHVEPHDIGAIEDKSAGRLSYPFYVRGAEYERSVVTGRWGADILKDEGVNDFVQRQGWKPVLN